MRNIAVGFMLGVCLMAFSEFSFGEDGVTSGDKTSFEQLSQSLLMIDQADQELEKVSQELDQAYQKLKSGQGSGRDLKRLLWRKCKLNRIRIQAFQELGETEQLFYRARLGRQQV